MKHPLRNLSKKNRNVISGILVGIAATFAVISFFDLPKDEALKLLASTAIFVFAIILLAVITIVIFKILGKIKQYLFND